MKTSETIYRLCFLFLLYIIFQMFTFEFEGLTKENFIRAAFFVITLLSSSYVIEKAKEKILFSSKDMVDLKLKLHLKFEKNEDKIEEIKDKFMQLHNDEVISLLYNHLLFFSEDNEIPLNFEDFKSIVKKGTIYDLIMNLKIKYKQRKILLYYYSLYNDDTKFKNIYIDFKSGKFIERSDESLYDFIRKNLFVFLNFVISVVGFITLNIDLVIKFIIIIVMIGIEVLEAIINIKEMKKDIYYFYEDIINILNNYN